MLLQLSPPWRGNCCSFHDCPFWVLMIVLRSSIRDSSENFVTLRHVSCVHFNLLKLGLSSSHYIDHYLYEHYFRLQNWLRPPLTLNLNFNKLAGDLNKHITRQTNDSAINLLATTSFVLSLTLFKKRREKWKHAMK